MVRSVPKLFGGTWTPSDTIRSNLSVERSRRRSGVASSESASASPTCVVPHAASVSSPAPRHRRGYGCPHSTSDAERAWDYGMLDDDWVAFPILSAEDDVRDVGTLTPRRSLWRERVLTSWKAEGHINIFEVSEFRRTPFKPMGQKGPTEGAELQIEWNARFASIDGRVTEVGANRIRYAKADRTGRSGYCRPGHGQRAFVAVDDAVRTHQVVAGDVAPLGVDRLRCRQGCDERRIEQMLLSHERTSRFTGCKLARLARADSLGDAIRALAQDPAEDIYVRMEARSYLCDVLAESTDLWFRPTLLEHPDGQMRLETVVALAETLTQGAFELLRVVLEDQRQPSFLRSACAWALGCHGSGDAAECLVRAFADIAPEIRNEALLALEQLGTPGVESLVAGLHQGVPDIAAGSAEALRRMGTIAAPHRDQIVRLAEQGASTWPTWTLAHLRRDDVEQQLAALQHRRKLFLQQQGSRH